MNSINFQLDQHHIGRFFFLFILLSKFLTLSYAQCISGDCQNGVGTYIFSDKTRAEGTWVNGKLNGKCKIFYKGGARYEGEMVDDQKSGFGKYTFSDGDYYEGLFADGKRNGQGKFVSLSGYSEEGTYINDTLTGFATLRFKSGDKYVGYTLNGKPDGEGVYTFAGGDIFEGVYKEGKRNGFGIQYFAKGGTLNGIWLDGEYVSGSNQLNSDARKKVIKPVLSRNKVYEVEVLLNDVLKLDMIFDTGAAEVYLTPDIVLTLIKTKTISTNDLLEGAFFVDANGNVNRNIRFNMRSIRIGDIIIENVACAVSSNIEGLSLLGLSALRKLGSFEFDFTNNEIRIR